eukprot:CAMPEP_0182913374 /NCGR_PEP_ID=MMETSP0034_2-20130328/38008_1 /TAXON_ID=156128 /ORGANISM="Nephroselmis pyriformis, Strain CCMP717" /LENGTH=471 /DNA_ID=CAMNT_0025050093 /DNA_START=149 /DNA_END=1564 /DNA_ORIENTATION=-
MAAVDGNTSVLSASQLTGIYKKIAPPEKEDTLKEKERLKTLSDERAAQWPNTIQAQRARKERQRLERLDQEELERRKVDKADAELKAERRRTTIERANKMLYDDTDKVKHFHGKLILSDVLYEREAQIAYKKQIASLRKMEDDEFQKRRVEAIELAEAAEARKYEEKRNRAMVQRDHQLEQLEEVRQKILEEAEQNMIEGEELRRNAEQSAAEEVHKAEARKKAARDAHTATIEANKALKAFKLLELEREAEEDRQIAAFAVKKEKMVQERRVRDEEKLREMQARRDRMAAIMERKFKEAEDDVNQRRRKEADEARLKEDMREQEKAERRAKEFVAIDRSRQQQLAIRAAMKDMEKTEEMEYVSEWNARNEEIKMEEEHEKRERMDKAKRLQAAQLRQVDKKAAKKAALKVRDLEDAARTRVLIAEDDMMFDQYSKVCMEEWALQGKSIKPMVLGLQKRSEITSGPGFVDA